jgi:hypothetical protein
MVRILPRQERLTLKKFNFSKEDMQRCSYILQDHKWFDYTHHYKESFLIWRGLFRRMRDKSGLAPPLSYGICRCLLTARRRSIYEQIVKQIGGIASINHPVTIDISSR